MERKRKKYILLLCVSAMLSMVFSVPMSAAEGGKLELTPEENEYLKEKEVLKIAVSDGWRPYMYENSRAGICDGFAIDMLEVLAGEKSGITIEYVKAEDYEEAISLVQSSQADIAAFMGKESLTEETAEGFVPYMTVPVQVLAKKGVDIFGPQKLTAAVPAGTDYLNLEKYENSRQVEYSTPEDCFMAIRNGQADFMSGDWYTITSLTDYYKPLDMFVHNVPDAYITVGFLTNASEDTLQGILSKLKDSMSEEEISKSVSFHGDRMQEEFKIETYVNKNFYWIINAFFVIIFVFVIILFIYLRGRLKRQSELYGYEQSYRMLADTFGQAGVEYDFLDDRLTLFGERHHEIDLPEAVNNFREKLRKRALRITLTEEDLEKFHRNSESGKTYQADFQCGMRGDGWNWFSMIYIVTGGEELYRRPSRLVGVLVDAEKQHQTQEKLVELGQYDKLTGVYNRSGGEVLLIKVLQNLEEYSQNAFLLMDVDRFKQINDNYGHLCGDDVLRMIGRNIQEIFEGDTIICRWGGDEFLMFVRGPGAEKGLVTKRVEELRRRMKQYRYEGKECPITLSIGGVVPKKGTTLRNLFKEADEILYQVKRNGRDAFRLQDESED